MKLATDEGEVHLTKAEIDAAHRLLGALTSEQRKRTVVSNQRINLILGPGKDGKTLPGEGLAGKDMNEAQKRLLLALLEARLRMINGDDLRQLRNDLPANLDSTTFGWWGPLKEGKAAYWPVVGPTIVLEYSPETQDGDPTNHAHNIYRNPRNEYGVAWLPVDSS